MKIALIREDKRPIDRRVPLTPEQCVEVQKMFPKVKVVVQPSPIRCFSDNDYIAARIELQEDLSDCDLLLGIKEVPIKELIADKMYFFFSHTIKKQDYNRELLRAILKKNITLVDYEVLTDEQGKRVIAFGRYAGIVGAYNGIWAYGKRSGLYDLKRAHECLDMEEMQGEYQKVKLPPIKIAVTGSGRVSGGAWEVLDGIGIPRVEVDEYLNEHFDEPVYVALATSDYNKTSDGSAFDLKAFYDDPTQGFESDFRRFLPMTDLFIAGAYWDMNAPVLFDKLDMQHSDFGIKVIADVTCDIEGSIPSTKQPSTIDDPIYDYDPKTDSVKPPLSDESHVTVMAVDNLPCELPRDASRDFGRMLIEEVLPNFLGEDKIGMQKRSIITHGGTLTEAFSYLTDYVAGKA